MGQAEGQLVGTIEGQACRTWVNQRDSGSISAASLPMVVV